MQNLPTWWAYVAGLLDGDGSIYVRLKPNNTYRYGFQVAPSVVFFQKNKLAREMNSIHKHLGCGYIRKRKDGIIELTIGDRPSIVLILHNLLPFLILKKKQAQLMLKIVRYQSQVTNAKKFVNLAIYIDKFGIFNYSKRRTINAQMVRNHLAVKGLLTPQRLVSGNAEADPDQSG